MSEDEPPLVQQVYDRGQQAWPDVALPRAALARHLLERCALQTLQEARAGDLYLACACAHGVPAALQHFEAAYLAQVPLLLVKEAPDFVREVQQRVRTRLLLAKAGERPKIAAYTGGGSLRSWVRVVVQRVAVDLHRDQGRAQQDGPELGAQLSCALDPELAVLKARYAPVIEEALQAAMTKLSSKQRNLLRLYHLRRQSREAIGELFGVHGVTVTRWLGDCHQALLKEIRRTLQERLHLDPREFVSLVRLVRSSLELDITQTLGRTSSS